MITCPKCGTTRSEMPYDWGCGVCAQNALTPAQEAEKAGKELVAAKERITTLEKIVSECIEIFDKTGFPATAELCRQRLAGASQLAAIASAERRTTTK